MDFGLGIRIEVNNVDAFAEEVIRWAEEDGDKINRLNRDLIYEFLEENITCRSDSSNIAIRGKETDGWFIDYIEPSELDDIIESGNKKLEKRKADYER